MEYTREELLLAHTVAFPPSDLNQTWVSDERRVANAESRVLYGWNDLGMSVDQAVFLLALNPPILPEGFEEDPYCHGVYRCGWRKDGSCKPGDCAVEVRVDEDEMDASVNVQFREDFAKCYKTFRYQIAGLLAAAAIELERRRAEKGKGM